WNGLTVGDLFDRIRKTMPQGSPGKLTKQQDADVLAYLLSFNKFPAGKTELQKQVEFLKEIRFEITKPEAKGRPESEILRRRYEEDRSCVGDRRGIYWIRGGPNHAAETRRR